MQGRRTPLTGNPRHRVIRYTAEPTSSAHQARLVQGGHTTTGSQAGSPGSEADALLSTVDQEVSQDC